MGIPKLSRDLAPYSRTVLLGKPSGTVGIECVEKLVIDGPGIVYFIYHRLLAFKLSGLDILDDQPSYTELCIAVRSLLIAIRSQGVQM